jgi:hypothetical protein
MLWATAKGRGAGKVANLGAAGLAPDFGIYLSLRKTQPKPKGLRARVPRPGVKGFLDIDTPERLDMNVRGVFGGRYGEGNFGASGFIMRDGGICDPIRHMGCVIEYDTGD